jgi:peptidoglycan LD-endopeptidase LytH
MSIPLNSLLHKYQPQFGGVVPFKPRLQRLVALSLSRGNTALSSAVLNNSIAFSQFIEKETVAKGAAFGMGGYLEDRAVYEQFRVFAATPHQWPKPEARSVHLGVDVWGPAGTPVRAPWGGTVHSLGQHDEPGNYGGLIILQHQIDGLTFHTLYGHLSRESLCVGENHYVSIGETFARFGTPTENGGWPPHLHFQIVEDLEGKMGDYPGVAEPSRRAYYAANCPDPDLMLNLNRFLEPQTHTVNLS